MNFNHGIEFKVRVLNELPFDKSSFDFLDFTKVHMFQNAGH